MRIIAGKNKGRKIVAPATLPVRPTTDLGKESLLQLHRVHSHQQPSRRDPQDSS